MGHQRVNTAPIYEPLASRLLLSDSNTVVLQKEHPWVEHLTSLSKRRVGALSSVSTLNHPCHVYGATQ